MKRETILAMNIAIFLKQSRQPRAQTLPNASRREKDYAAESALSSPSHCNHHCAIFLRARALSNTKLVSSICGGDITDYAFVRTRRQPSKKIPSHARPSLGGVASGPGERSLRTGLQPLKQPTAPRTFRKRRLNSFVIRARLQPCRKIPGRVRTTG